MRTREEYCLAAVLGRKTSATEHEHHGMLTLELESVVRFGSVVELRVVGRLGARHDIGSHNRFLSLKVKAAAPKLRDLVYVMIAEAFDIAYGGSPEEIGCIRG